MKILSPEDAKGVDRKLSATYGIDEILLMENAGNDTYELIKSILDDKINQSRFIIICGVGNNGGDGLVVARKLLKHTNEVYVLIIGDTQKFTPSTKKNYEILSKLTNNIHLLNPSSDLEGFKTQLDEYLKNFTSDEVIIIDALLGIGIRPPLREDIALVVQSINALKKHRIKILSIDLPSGFISSFDKGDVLSNNTVVNADYTITFFSIKAGMFLPEVKRFTGNITVSTLGLSADFIDTLVEHNTFYLTSSDVRILKRDVSSNKGSNGRVIVIGGSDKYFGASILVSKSASKTAVGYIIAFVLEKFNQTMKVACPDVVSIPVPSGDRGYFSEGDARFILDQEVIKDSDVLIIGNGLGQNEETLAFLKTILTSTNNILVIDADGINLLSKDVGILKSMKDKHRVILTPHLLEFSRLSGFSLDDVKERPFSVGKKFSEDFGINLVLKDNVNYLFFYDGDVWISNLNTPVLARAGTGDILAGLIGGNIAFLKDIKEGVKAGVYMLGEASKRFEKDMFYPTPIDIIEAL
ncbi:MAG: NAD(P)H-hydrate dehydratase [Spirochaetes bacterium]|nr:NAD(P)H-hydrate dehydratase [Spirochaetota bacterium]